MQEGRHSPPSVKLFGCLLSASMTAALSATRRPANVAAVVRVTVPRVAGCPLPCP
jgi:hypothetical protein